MQINKHYVLGLALSLTLVACGKEEKTKTVTVDNPTTLQQLKDVQKERDALQEQIKNLPDAKALKADLDKANTQITDLGTSIKNKDVELAKAKKDLEDAKKNDSEKVKDLETKVTDLETQKDKLTKDLTAAQGERTKLTALVDGAKRDEVMFEEILNYAVSHKVTKLDDIGSSLDADIKGLDAALQKLAANEPGLKEAITSQAQLVVKATAELENVSKNMKGVYATLSDSANKGETLAAADKVTYETLKAYFAAATAEETAKKAKAEIDTKIEGLNKDIVGLDNTLATADADLKKFNEELLALATADKLDSPRAKELTGLIEAGKKTIADTNLTKAAKTKDLGEQTAKAQVAKDEIAAQVKIQKAKLKDYNDTAVSAARDVLAVAEKNLDERVAAYQQAQKDVVTQQGSKTHLTALKDFYITKLKPAQA